MPSIVPNVICSHGLCYCVACLACPLAITLAIDQPRSSHDVLIHFDTSAHPPSQSKDQMQSRTTLQVVLLCRLVIAHLLASEDQPLLRWWDAFLLLNALLDLADFIIGLDIEFDLLAGEGADSGNEIST